MTKKALTAEQRVHEALNQGAPIKIIKRTSRWLEMKIQLESEDSATTVRCPLPQWGWIQQHAVA